ncbi:hypothetical protein [Planktothricoides raciborskii]|uniref:Uncharacterized protein n=1 Tax=Planktothricoides raciborskii GIHE-MW2 TaxID=2792601 RepID=A0AAU8JHB5_9CYAN
MTQLMSKRSPLKKKPGFYDNLWKQRFSQETRFLGVLVPINLGFERAIGHLT